MVPFFTLLQKGKFRRRMAVLSQHAPDHQSSIWKQTPADFMFWMAKETKRDHICVERPSLHSLQHSPYAGFHPFACIWLLAVNDLTHSLQKFSFLQKQKSGMNFFPQTGAVLFLLIITGKLEHSLKLFFCPVKGYKCHWLTLKICMPDALLPHSFSFA